jgi:hypothetical protein
MVGMKLANIAGKKFGRLTAIRRIKSATRTTWICKCECGKTKKIQAGNLFTGATKSCGCFRRQISSKSGKKNIYIAIKALIKHGHRRGATNTPEYNSFRGAKARCTDPKNTRWKDYGGRGIQFKFSSFVEFLKELGLRPEPKNLYSVERMNNEGHYEPGNVRWATRSEQAHNKRPSHA